MAIGNAHRSALARMVGDEAVLTAESDLGLYEYDGGVDRARPEIVLFPASAEQVSEILAYCTRHEIPVVARGAGTGLSGGAIPRAGGVVLSLVRMNRILEMNLDDEYLKVQPGVVNLDLSIALAPHGYFYAPDPSSQRACTVGGNVAENAGGPHTLVYGVTSNHVLGIEFVTADGEVHVSGGPEGDLPGLDIRGLLIGSEGTLAVVTAIWVRIMRSPEAVETLLAVYDDPEQAGQSVSDIIGRGVLPIALEMMDGVMLRMVEEATNAGYPLDAAAILLVELAGPVEEIREQLPLIESICASAGARSIRIAADAAERALLWKGRKNAFGAIGRVSPTYYVQDGVVPRSRLPKVLGLIQEIARKHDLTISNIFHAGDGNLHPIILFNARKPGDLKKAEQAGEEILEICVAEGGTITGEHGVGMEKNELFGKLYSPVLQEHLLGLKCKLDPAGILNPGKLLPAAQTLSRFENLVATH
ncbi:MAG: FAD-binding protein [Bryobacterales bacterium]|nr:FAD-binding protein [Bryobacterales bacterium]